MVFPPLNPYTIFQALEPEPVLVPVLQPVSLVPEPVPSEPVLALAPQPSCNPP